MPRVIRMALEYDGTCYYGFARQPRLPTIQGVMERALAELLGHPVRVTPGGRTDAGVHARGQVLSFRTEARMPAEAISPAVNARLPGDIVAGAVRAASPGFDARRSARRRHYRYSVWNRDRPNLWLRRYSLQVAGALNETAMAEAAATLLGRHDFTSFIGHAAQQPQASSPVRTIERAQWSREGDLLNFDCSADGFARHMVRTIVGTLLWVGRGRLSREQFGHVLAARDRRTAGPTVPPGGLTLVRVDYDDRESQA